jgi:hypothetical protein
MSVPATPPTGRAAANHNGSASDGMECPKHRIDFHLTPDEPLPPGSPVLQPQIGISRFTPSRPAKKRMFITLCRPPCYPAETCRPDPGRHPVPSGGRAHQREILRDSGARRMKRQGINTFKTYSVTLNCDGEPRSPGMAGVGSDVGTGNAEIYLVTANSFARSDTYEIVCIYCR